MNVKSTTKPVDWAGVVGAILERLLLTQSELAERCKVAQQTVSAWKTNDRVPGRYAQRVLVQLAREAGYAKIGTWFPVAPGAVRGVAEARGEWNTQPSAASQKNAPDAEVERKELLRLFDKLSDAERREVLDYVRFKVTRGP